MEPRRGFTLIELLIVIAIIGVLSAVIITSLNASRERASDSQKITGVKEAAKAMELERNQFSGRFPTYSTTAAAAIGLNSSLEVWPTGVTFIPNTSDNSQYCIYAVLDRSEAGDYYVASELNVGHRTTLPTLEDCDKD